MVAEVNQLMSLAIRKYFKRLTTGLFLLLVFFNVQICRAETIRLISDEETELFLADILRPIYGAIHVPFNRNKVFIVQDNSLNAFVADRNDMFVHTGTLMQADNYNQLEGVLAHEAGHIQGGHILRQKLKMQDMQSVSLASVIAAGVIGAASGRPDVGMAIVLGGQTSALHSIIAYQKQEERSADEAAVSILKKIGKSPEGLRDFMKKIQRQNMLSGIEETPYFRTHPMSAERLGFLNNAAQGNPFVVNQKLQARFEMIKAKLVGFLVEPRRVWQIYPKNDVSRAGRYAHAVVLFRQSEIENALRNINSLIQEEPQNPFFRELKGQIYFESGNAAQAVAEYKIANKILPNAATIQISLAQAMLENSPSPQEVKEIINLLNKALIQNRDSAAWLLLAQAYGMDEDMAYANYASAEFSLRMGELDTAEKQIKAAREALKPQGETRNGKNAARARNTAQLKQKLDDLEKRIKQLKKI